MDVRGFAVVVGRALAAAFAVQGVGSAILAFPIATSEGPQPQLASIAAAPIAQFVVAVVLWTQAHRLAPDAVTGDNVHPSAELLGVAAIRAILFGHAAWVAGGLVSAVQSAMASGRPEIGVAPGPEAWAPVMASATTLVLALVGVVFAPELVRARGRS